MHGNKRDQQSIKSRKSVQYYITQIFSRLLLKLDQTVRIRMYQNIASHAEIRKEFLGSTSIFVYMYISDIFLMPHNTF
jgi:hypothetical protein